MCASGFAPAREGGAAVTRFIYGQIFAQLPGRMSSAWRFPFPALAEQVPETSAFHASGQARRRIVPPLVHKPDNHVHIALMKIFLSAYLLVHAGSCAGVNVKTDKVILVSAAARG